MIINMASRATKIAFALVLLLNSIWVNAQQTDPDSLFKSFIYQGATSNLPYRLLSPSTIKKDKKYPLIISLHGSGERGDDNVAQLKWCKDLFLNKENREKFPGFVLAPQCPAKQRWSATELKEGICSSFPDKPTEPMKNLMELLDNIEKTYPIDRERIYITGLSLGGSGTWDLAIRMPGRFAAIAPVCGFIDTAQADKIIEMPTWVFHGSADVVVPVKCSRSMVASIKRLGGKKVQYSEYLGVDHFSWIPAYKEPKFYKWLYKQRLGR